MERIAEVMPRARALAGIISQHSPTALALTKQCIWESLDTGLDDALDKLGFQTVGYGCMTCIGNSGPLPEASPAGPWRTAWDRGP